jgi:opacity protein-like surface antigen
VLNAIALRLRQLTLAALLVASTIPVLASSAAASTTCFDPQFIVGLPGGTAVATIQAHECVTGGTYPDAFTSSGPFTVKVGTITIGAGTLNASHVGCNVTATFQGQLVTGQSFTGSLTFLCGYGSTTVQFENIGTVTVIFVCTGNGPYVCAPIGLPTFVPSGGRDD